jgi:hypothetical protein
MKAAESLKGETLLPVPRRTFTFLQERPRGQEGADHGYQLPGVQHGEYGTRGRQAVPLHLAQLEHAAGWRSGRSYFDGRLFRRDRQDGAGHLFSPKRAYRRTGYFSR